MKKQTGIWIDSSKAILVTLTGENENVEELASGIESRVNHEKEGDKGSFSGSQHINNDATFEERRKQQKKQFMKTVSAKISDHDELYIFGPAETKTSLKKHLEEDNMLANKLKATEAADSMTMNQVVSQVKAFFNS